MRPTGETLQRPSGQTGSLSIWCGCPGLGKCGKVGRLREAEGLRRWEAQGSLCWERASMVGQRQKVNWAAILGHLPRLCLLLHNGSREHLSSSLAPGSWHHSEAVL